MNSNTVQEKLEAELSQICDDEVLSSIKQWIVRPYCVLRDWDYGEEGEAYECWTVLEHEPSNTGIAYCENGFGPSDTWGLISLTGDSMSIGMDCRWFKKFEEAFRESFAWEGENPEVYEIT